MSHNNFTTFPSALLNLKQMNVLDLANNKIRAIPEEIQGLEATELVLTAASTSKSPSDSDVADLEASTETVGQAGARGRGRPALALRRPSARDDDLRLPS